MKIKNVKTEKRMRLKGKIRSRITGTADRPRLSIYRSNKFVYGQIIDDQKGITLVSVNDMKTKKKGGKLASAKEMGAALAKGAAEKKITQVVFDRNGFRYAGRVKEFADGARDGGLIF